MTRNSRAITPEDVARHKRALEQQAEEFELWINNDRSWHGKKINVFKTLWKKYSQGNFNVILAQRAFMYLTDEAARWYNNQHFEGASEISVKARRMVDTSFVSDFVAAAKNREYDFMN